MRNDDLLANLFVDWTLVEVETRGRVGAHHEAAGADAGKASGRVDAFAPVARVGDLAALVDVFAALAVH